MKNIRKIDKEVKRIYRKFKISSNPTCNELKKVLEKMGYPVRPYSYEDKKEFGKRIPPAHTAESNVRKFVLYNDTLCETDLTIAFAHEIAHINLCHLHRFDGPDDTSTYQDYEADVFVYRFLNYKATKHKNICLIITFALWFLLSIRASYLAGYNTAITSDIPVFSPQTDVVITSFGAKYHKPTCKHVKYKTNTIHITEAEAINANKEPCADCFGE